MEVLRVWKENTGAEAMSTEQRRRGKSGNPNQIDMKTPKGSLLLSKK